MQRIFLLGTRVSSESTTSLLRRPVIELNDTLLACSIYLHHSFGFILLFVGQCTLFDTQVSVFLRVVGEQ